MLRPLTRTGLLSTFRKARITNSLAMASLTQRSGGLNESRY